MIFRRDEVLVPDIGQKEVRHFNDVFGIFQVFQHRAVLSPVFPECCFDFLRAIYAKLRREPEILPLLRFMAHIVQAGIRGQDGVGFFCHRLKLLVLFFRIMKLYGAEYAINLLIRHGEARLVDIGPHQRFLLPVRLDSEHGASVRFDKRSQYPAGCDKIFAVPVSGLDDVQQVDFFRNGQRGIFGHDVVFDAFAQQPTPDFFRRRLQ